MSRNYDWKWQLYGAWISCLIHLRQGWSLLMIGFGSNPHFQQLTWTTQQIGTSSLLINHISRKNKWQFSESFCSKNKNITVELMSYIPAGQELRYTADICFSPAKSYTSHSHLNWIEKLWWNHISCFDGLDLSEAIIKKHNHQCGLWVDLHPLIGLNIMLIKCAANL
jgi:hypothetical protein